MGWEAEHVSVGRSVGRVFWFLGCKKRMDVCAAPADRSMGKRPMDRCGHAGWNLDVPAKHASRLLGPEASGHGVDPEALDVEMVGMDSGVMDRL